MALPVPASWAIAFNGLCAGISITFLLPFLSQSSPAAIDGVEAAPAADPAAQAIPLAVAVFFAAVSFIYAHLRNRDDVRRRIPEVMLFVLCASIALLDLSLCMQPGPIQAPVLGAAVAQVLPPAAVAALFLSTALIYAHGGHPAGAAADQQNPAAVEVLNRMALAATLVTCVLSLFAAVLVLNNTK